MSRGGDPYLFECTRQHQELEKYKMKPWGVQVCLTLGVSLWSPLLDQSVGASEAWPLHTDYSCLLTEVIFPNGLANLFDIEILEL